MKTFKIGHFEFSENSPAFIVAELSANHKQDYDIAVKTIYKAREVGADAIKLQTYTPDTITIDCRSGLFKIEHNSIWDGKYMYDLYKEAYTPWEWQPELKKIAQSIGLEFFTSPFDFTAVDFLEKMNVDAYKIASLEIVDIPLIEYAASKGKPMIIATGIAREEDIAEAVSACKRMGNENIILLKCTSTYPTPFEDMNLLTIPDMEKRFDVLTGLSDHSLGITAPVAAVTLGAKVIEKHFILDKKSGSPDAAFSLDPGEFSLMVKSVREAEKALGKVSYDLNARSLKSREHARSLFIVKDIKAGEELTPSNVRSIRPGYGLHPKYYKMVLGKKAVKDIERGTPLSWDLIK